MVKIIERLSQGTIGTMRQYRSNVAEFAQIVGDAKRKKGLSVMQRMDEIRELNKMLATLYDMQDRVEKKVVKVEVPMERPEETVEIKKGVVTVTVPKEPEEHEDPESLAHSSEFGGMLREMPVPIVEKKKEPVAEPEINPALKETFQS